MEKGTSCNSGRPGILQLLTGPLAPIMRRREPMTSADPILRKILNNHQVDVVFHPVVALDSYDILGFEALARGPRASRYEEPLTLLAAADYYNCRLEVETICHRSAILAAAGNLQSRYLFLNINPRFIHTDQYSPRRILKLLEDSQIDPRQIVFEITERTWVDDYAILNSYLTVYRRQGIRVAIDDAGAGYSSLQAIAELQPDFVKMDLSLVRDIDKNTVKQAVLETIAYLCAKINAAVICEGIERMEELQMVQDMGCNYGQGFLFYDPGSLIPQPNHSLALLSSNKFE